MTKAEKIPGKSPRSAIDGGAASAPFRQPPKKPAFTPFRQAAAVTMVWLGAFGLSAYIFGRPDAAATDSETLAFALLGLIAFPLVAWFVALSNRSPATAPGGGTLAGMDTLALKRDLAEMERRIEAIGSRIHSNQRKLAETLHPPVKPAKRPHRQSRPEPVRPPAQIIDLAAMRHAKGLKAPSPRA